MSIAELFLKSALSNAGERTLLKASRVIERPPASSTDTLSILANIGKRAESTAAQAVKTITMAEIRTPEFNSTLARIKKLDPVVAESIEKRLNGYNVNNERGLAKAQAMMDSVIKEYSLEEDAFAKQVAGARSAIEESAKRAAENARIAAEKAEMDQIAKFIDEVRYSNPVLANKLIDKVTKLEKTDPTRARTYMKDLIARYYSGDNAAKAYSYIESGQSSYIGSNYDLSPYPSTFGSSFGSYTPEIETGLGFSSFDSLF